MGTLLALEKRIRYAAKDIAEFMCGDTELLVRINSRKDDIVDKLSELKSNLAYAESSIAMVDGTGEYSISSVSHNGIFKAWIDGEDWFLIRKEESDKIHYDVDNTTQTPEAYYLTENQYLGLLWVPGSDDDGTSVKFHYWKRFDDHTSLTTDSTYFEGIFDRWLANAVAMDILHDNDRDASHIESQLDFWWGAAMNKVFQRGVARMRQASNMFTARGV